MNQTLGITQVNKITMIVGDGAASAVYLLREMAQSALGVIPALQQSVTATNRRIHEAAGRTRREVIPIQSRSPHPMY